MTSELSDDLTDAARELNSRGARNYTVSFGVFPAAGVGEGSLQEIVHACLGTQARLGGATISSTAEVVSTVRWALEYRGDDELHPNLRCVDGMRDSGRIDSLVHSVELLVTEADLIAEIWLSEGHPFYPVFWDFAFVVSHGQDGLILVGSSSD